VTNPAQITHPSQALTSREVAKALGIEHAFLLQRAQRMMGDINNPSFVVLHFVAIGDAMLLSQVAASLVAMDLDLDESTVSDHFGRTVPPGELDCEAPNEVTEALATQARVLTKRLHALICKKRALVTSRPCP
jgi:hypothetical protein